MATLDVQGGRGRRRAVDSQVPLVPFIDLLLCCVMFLLVTAVWNQLAGQDTALQPTTADAAPDTDSTRVTLIVKQAGYVLTSGAGAQIDIPGSEGAPDPVALRAQLRAQRDAFPGGTSLAVTADDGVAYQHVVEAMDLARGVGFSSLLVGGS